MLEVHSGALQLGTSGFIILCLFLHLAKKKNWKTTFSVYFVLSILQPNASLSNMLPEIFSTKTLANTLLHWVG